MVTIVEFAERQNSDKETFYALIVESGLEAIKSQNTGMTYFTKKRASVPSTFTAEECKAFIGEQLPGSVKRVECEPYEITDEETGEVIKLSHRYEYLQEGETAEEVVNNDKVQQPVSYQRPEKVF
ncbi:MAG: hypothetical protein ACLFNL_08215 [Bacteroidales bacterium]